MSAEVRSEWALMPRGTFTDEWAAVDSVCEADVGGAVASQLQWEGRGVVVEGPAWVMELVRAYEGSHQPRGIGWPRVVYTKWHAGPRSS